MKILFTANRFPYPPFRGDKLKIYHLARLLSSNHELHLITFLQDKNDLKHLAELEKIFTKIHLIPLTRVQSFLNSLFAVFKKKPFQVAYFHSSKMVQTITNVHKTEHYDAVHVQHLRMAQYWSDYQDIPRILDLPDAYSLYWKRRIQAFSGWKKIFARMEERRVYQYEKVLTQYDLTLVCSKEDATYLRKEHGLKNINILPNGVDTEAFPIEKHDYAKHQTILFTGNMDYAPNVDAVIYFAREIFPDIKKKCSEARFIIAGQRPVSKVKALTGKDIEVTGFVADLSEHYRQAAIVVAPLRFGAGTQNKVLEAMAMGVPVVSGQVGFEGLNIHSGEGVFLATDTDTFLKTCLQLLKDLELRKQTGETGQMIIKKHFSWPSIAQKLEAYFDEIISKRNKNKL